MSTRTKIAPVLTLLARDGTVVNGMLPDARAELRAFRAVARAALRVERNRPGNCWQDEATALRTALDRLYRVSRGGR